MTVIETACYALALVSTATLCLALTMLTLALNTARAERAALVKQLTRID